MKTTQQQPAFAHLREVPALAKLRDRELASLAPCFERCSVAAGDMLMQQGAQPRQAFLIVDGEADVRVDGRIVAVVGPGDFVGETGMLRFGSRTATVVAATAMQVLAIGPHDWTAVIAHPVVAKDLARQLAARVRDADARVEAVR